MKDTKKPKVWALGTSINSIGKSHSILMSVKNSLNILDAFNELWNELDHSTIWKHSRTTMFKEIIISLNLSGMQKLDPNYNLKLKKSMVLETSAIFKN